MENRMHRVAPVKADMKEAETEEHGEGSGPIKPTPSEGESSSVSRALLNEEEEVPLSVVFYTLTKLHNKLKLAWKLILFMVYFTLFLIIVSLQRDISKGHDVEDAVLQQVVGAMTSGLENNFAFSDIGSIDDWFTWVELALIPTLYSTTWYNGENRSEATLHTIGYLSHFLGGLRILQTRSVSNVGSYCYATPLENIVAECLSEEGLSQDRFGNATLHPEVLTHPAFTYSTDSLGADGFQVLLSFDKSSVAQEVERVDTLKRLRWVDEYTRQLVIDGTLYNANTKQFVALRLEAEIDLAGGVETSSTTTVLKLDYYDFDHLNNTIRCILEAIWVVFVLYQILVEIGEYTFLMKCSMKSYLLGREGSGNLLDIISIINSFIIIGMWTQYQFHPNRVDVMNKVANGSSFVNFPDLLPLAAWEIRYMTFVSINVMLSSLRAVQYFAITNNGRQLVNALTAATPEIVTFLPMFTTVLLGFAFCGHLLFGQSHEEWSTVASSVFVVVEINFGLYDIHSLFLEEDNLVSSLYILITLLGMCVVFINVFLAIVMAAWDAMTTNDSESQINAAFNIPEVPFRTFVKLLMTPRSYMQLTNILRKLKLYDGTEASSAQHWSAVSHVLDNKEVYRDRFAKFSFNPKTFTKFAVTETATAQTRITQRFVDQVTNFIWRPAETQTPDETALQLALDALERKNHSSKHSTSHT